MLLLKALSLATTPNARLAKETRAFTRIVSPHFTLAMSSIHLHTPCNVITWILVLHVPCPIPSIAQACTQMVIICLAGVT